MTPITIITQDTTFFKFRQALEAYQALDWPIVPMNVSGTYPIVACWNDFATHFPDRKTFNTWENAWWKSVRTRPDGTGTKIGLLPGELAELVVLEINKDTLPGRIETLKEANLLPETPTIREGSKEYYLFDNDERKFNSGTISPGITIHFDGDFVVLPPAVWPDHAAEWIISPNQVELALVPEWLVDMTTGGRGIDE